MCKGGYIIVDGGYQKIPCLMDPWHDATGLRETHWSEFLESVRKDVECTFGILKRRFRWLKNAIQYHSEETLEAAIKTCAILHNMLLAYDGLDVFEWNTDWEDEDPDMPVEDIVFHTTNDMGDNEVVIRYCRETGHIETTEPG